MSSAIGAYSTLLSPTLVKNSSSCSDGGMNMFQRPAARAFALSSSKMGGISFQDRYLRVAVDTREWLDTRTGP